MSQSEKIIQFLEAGEKELVKQLLRGNPDLVPELVKYFLCTRGEYDGIVTDFYNEQIAYYVYKWRFMPASVSDCVVRHAYTNIELHQFMPASVGDCVVNKFGFLTCCHDFALTTQHNVEAIIRAWAEEKELTAEDIDWTPLTKTT